MGITIPALFAAAQGSRPISLVSRLPDGPCNSVFVQASLAFVGNGSALDVVDVSNPSDPVRLGRALLPGIAREIILVGDYVYIASNRPGLTIVDVSTPRSPVIVTSVDLDDAVSITRAGNLAFVAHDTEITILDISSPSSPQRVSAIPLETYPRDIAIRSDTLFIAAGASGIYVYDVRTPAEPSFMKQFFLKDGFHPKSVTSFGPYLFVTSSPPGIMDYGKMHILKTMGSDSLHELSSITLPGDWGSSGRDVFVQESVAYVSYGSDVGDGMYIVNIDSVEAPKVIHNLWPDDPISAFVSDSTLFLACYESGLKIYDVSHPASPQLLHVYHTSAKTQGVALSGPWAYLSSGGIKAVDLSIPQSPVVYGPFATSSGPIEIGGMYAYVKSFGCIDALEISGGETLSKTGRLCTVDATAFEARNNLLYVAASDSALHIADMSNPSQPVWLGAANMGGGAYDVSVFGSYACIALGRAGVSIVDVSNPTMPQLASILPVSGVPLGIDVFEDRAYVALRDSGLSIIDISNPNSPSVISRTPLSSYNSSVTIAFPFAYVATFTGITVIDVSNAAAPQIVDSVLTADLPRAVEASGMYFYVADYSGGLFIFANDLLNDVELPGPEVPLGFRLSQNFPNPFNSRTRIVYELPRAGDVVITIHALTGEMLETAFKGRQSRGTQFVDWDPSGLSSGVYFYRVEFNGTSITRGCVLLR